MWNAEKAFAEFQARIEAWKSLSPALNEADTRLKVINEILIPVLGWNLADIETEKYCREVGFSDYVFKQANVDTSFVLEAKKSGDSFVVPEGKFGSEPIPFALLGKESPSAKSALLQAIGYAVTLGARYVAISNGKQWLLTLTFIDNQSVDERLVFAFDSFDAIAANFRQFWECFSPQGIASNAVHDRFFESRLLPPPPKLSRSIPGYPVPSKRNIFVNELSYVLRLLWETIARTESTADFIADCYVETKADEHLIGYAKNLLARRQNEDVKYFEGTVEGTPHIDQTLVDIGDKPFVFLGDVGHGKSTFLNHLRFSAATGLLRGYIQIELSFLDRPDKAPEVTDYIYREIERQLFNRLSMDIFADEVVRGVLYTEFQRFKRSARYRVLDGKPDAQLVEEHKFIEEYIADRHTYLAALFKYLKKGQKKSVVIFFDNLDRRSPEIQEEAFLKASAIARDWECATFVCLRPDTFFDSIKRGALDALAPKTFTVGAPDLGLVLKRRFDYARRIATGDACKETFGSSAQDVNVSINLPSVADIFGCCEFSARKGADAIEMLSALSNGNIRLLIELTRVILTSGHLDTRKIGRVIRESGGYTVPDFEAVKTLLFGDFDQFDPKSSIFINLFDIFHTDPKEHFLRILLLDYLNRSEVITERFGYVDEQDLLAYSNTYYFNPVTFKKHLSVLVKGGCIQVENHGAASPRYRILTRGRYHIGGLVRTFQYLDAMIIDTPITDNDARRKIELTDDIIGRIYRTRIFAEYLKKSATLFHDAQVEKLFNNIFDDIEAELQRVESRVAKAQ